MDYNLLDFQREKVREVIDGVFQYDYTTGQPYNVLFNSPTGSGKTLMAASLYKNMLNVLNSREIEGLTPSATLNENQDAAFVFNNAMPQDVCFFWISPGAGELEDQNYRNFKKYLPELSDKIKTFDDLISDNELKKECIYFINWEALNQSEAKTNKVDRNERFRGFKELLKDSDLNHVLFIDEAHRNAVSSGTNKKIERNNEVKALSWIKTIHPILKIRISATIAEKLKEILQGIAEEENITLISSSNKPLDRKLELDAMLNSDRFQYTKVPESDVIAAGLITEDSDINDNDKIELGAGNIADSGDEIKELLKRAINKQKQLKKLYGRYHYINPLILIQIPSDGKSTTSDNKEETLQKDMVLNILKNIDSEYTIENKKVAVWLSEEKTESSNDELVKLNSSYMFLIIKQAVATGWDCPRAKILVKLRNNMNAAFEVQTIGRIRRTIIYSENQKNDGIIQKYEEQALNFSYIYTCDRDFIEGHKEQVMKSSQKRTINIAIKSGFMPQTPLLTETKDDSYNVCIGSKELAKKINNKLPTDIFDSCTTQKQKEIKVRDWLILNEKNKADYATLDPTSSPKFQRLDGTVKNKTHVEITKNLVKTSMEFNSAITMIARKVNLPRDMIYRVLCALFYKNDNKQIKDKNGSILQLSEVEFCNFIYNMCQPIYHTMRKLMSDEISQDLTSIGCCPTKIEYTFPEKDTVVAPLSKGWGSSNNMLYEGVGMDYLHTDIYSASGVESKFNSALAGSKEIEYFVKNGESSSDAEDKYFRIVYLDNMNKQHYFYPDYIVKGKNGVFYIIETKGESNIDDDAPNKLNRLKQYVADLHKQGIHNVEFYFVRNKSGLNELVFSNTKFVDDVYDTRYWMPIGEDVDMLFK